MHLKFPSVVDQIKAHKNAYNELQIQPVLEFAQAGDWSPTALPEGADGWLVVVSGTEHYVLDASVAKRKLAISRAFNDRTSVTPDDLRRTAEVREALFRLRQMQPFALHIVAVQLGRNELGGLSVEERARARRPREYGLGVREIADALRIINRLESPVDLGIYCSADRFGSDMAPCFSVENRALKLSSHSIGAASSAFAEATWFLPQK